jgi:Tol biopolymer transport system component
VNKPVVPGLTFGWAPSPMGVLAFVDDKKRLVLIDRVGHKLEVPGATDVLLPAWSPDGTRIAYLQKKGKKAYTLNVIEVGR